jgi:transposase
VGSGKKEIFNHESFFNRRTRRRTRLNIIFVGCDSHDKTLVTKIALNREAAEKKTFSATGAGRKRMIQDLKERSQANGGARVVVAYEASGNGFILSDELKAAGFDCHVLAPSKIERSTKQKRTKNDDRDAERLLEILRGHYLAGNRMPSVWVPDQETRDDREPVRMRQDVSQKATAVKTQVQMLLKRNGMEKPEGIGKGWTKGYRDWLKAITEAGANREGMRTALDSLLRQLKFLEDEIQQLDKAMQRLADSPRWKPVTDALMKETGVGLKVALKYATDIGDFARFRRGRQVGAYFGLVPSSQESGETKDRKGHITREGSPSSRQILCQATWARVRHDEKEREVYRHLVARNPKKKKIALVACMRRLSVRLWHVGLQAQQNMKSEISF